MADALGSKIVSVNTTEGAAFGAALLAGVGTDVWPDVLSACQSTVKPTASMQPNDKSSAHLQQYYDRYRALYPALAGEFANIAALVGKH